ncbi:HNH endonuclease [Staphylococcus haemolyticus]|uniref:HNH endonuclease n=1 Tax=Staphylococcus haemolyticus TaxID=1283 RepID=UPI0039E2C3F7
MIVNSQKSINFRNECNCKVDYKELEKAILWVQSKPTSSNKKIYMYGLYPCVSVHDKKYHVHRLLMMYWLGRKLGKDEHVHHINGDKSDASKSNLTILTASQHLSGHNKGKSLTQSHRDKIAEAGRKRKGMKMKRKYNIDSKELKQHLENGLSISKIARIYNCDWTVIKQRINENPELLEGD